MDKKRYTAVLKKHGLNATQCRIETLNLFFNSGHALTHSDVEVKIGKKFDRVTLYRTLHSFENNGLLHKIAGPDGILRYALCSDSCTSHTHFDGHVHFNCSRCNKTFCLDNVKIPSVNISREYQVEKIAFLAEGICKNCQSNF